ncbi:MAG: hypothetical protein QF898_04520 [SAR202 cluster bacterium]|jgi:hypothetical protein|nr:hypothetical protein [SAR202 cluster bacterium]MDP6714669.1 hypothetical protein [SAR202 cluster bacterium]
MNNPQAAMEQFESEYGNAHVKLAKRQPDVETFDALLVAEESRPNLGTESYAPGWIQPFVAMVDSLAQDHFMRLAASTGGLAGVRAVRMGYGEGYVAENDD